MKPEIIISAMASWKFKKDEMMLMHTLTCKCGKLMIRSFEYEPLLNYKENPFFSVSCCGSQLSYTGEKLFLGDDIIGPKSQIIKDICKLSGNPHIDVPLLKMDPKDLLGTPTKY